MNTLTLCLILSFIVSLQAAVIAVLVRVIFNFKRVSSSNSMRSKRVVRSLRSRINVLEDEVKELKVGVQKLNTLHSRNINKTKHLEKCYSRTCDVLSGLIESGLLIKNVKYSTSFDEVYDELKEVVEFYDINNITPEEVLGLFGKLNPLEDLVESK